ncbi:hypothetical protein Cfor_02857 [Coptotermes formosanus]|uniref:Uncharacterized protein n=1 Tax=Coptotermes formosanus TaxID=36987 RepID=A0A6L2PHB7_COPFO|nr:hypothetical protein Cfor_02857 [Coptotermes formosanus]
MIVKVTELRFMNRLPVILAVQLRANHREIVGLNSSNCSLIKFVLNIATSGTVVNPAVSERPTQIPVCIVIDCHIEVTLTTRQSIIAHYFSVQSSSSEFGTFCDGLRCPPGSNCMVFTSVINGNKTCDKRCSNIDGEVVRQETITTSNGKMCIKNLTMMGEKVNMQESCRNLSKAEIKQEENNRKIQEAVQAALKREQDEIEDAIEEKARLYDEWRLQLEKAITRKTEAINKAAKMQADAAEQLEARLAEMEGKLEATFG